MTRSIRDLTAVDYQALITGLPKYCPNTEFTLASQSYTSAQLVQLLTLLMNASVSVSTARTEWKKAIAVEQSIEITNLPAVRELRTVLGVMFSNDATTLAGLAITPRKAPKALTPEQLTIRAAKARATRLARGTTSKKQKATISGDVTGVNITPVTRGTPTIAAPAPVVSSGTVPLVITNGVPATTSHT